MHFHHAHSGTLVSATLAASAGTHTCLSMSDEGVGAHECLFIQTDLPRGAERLRGVGLLKAHCGRHLGFEGDSMLTALLRTHGLMSKLYREVLQAKMGRQSNPKTVFPKELGRHSLRPFLYAHPTSVEYPLYMVGTVEAPRT